MIEASKYHLLYHPLIRIGDRIHVLLIAIDHKAAGTALNLSEYAAYPEEIDCVGEGEHGRNRVEYLVP